MVFMVDLAQSTGEPHLVPASPDRQTGTGHPRLRDQKGEKGGVGTVGTHKWTQRGFCQDLIHQMCGVFFGSCLPPPPPFPPPPSRPDLGLGDAAPHFHDTWFPGMVTMNSVLASLQSLCRVGVVWQMLLLLSLSRAALRSREEATRCRPVV